jgi:tetratricopeptide (TPR) repeat protein
MEEMLPHYEQLIHSPEVLVDYLAGVVITFISVDRAADAEAPARRVLELRHQHGLPPGRLDYMLAVSIALQGKHAEAEPLLREALLELDESRWTYHWVSGLLGACLAGLGNFEEAEPLLLESYEQMDPPEALRMHKRDALERIVSLYEAWGREDRAAEWRTRRGT